MPKTLSYLTLFLLLSNLLFAQGKIMKIETAEGSSLKGELLGVKDGSLYLLTEKVDENDLGELRKGIKILPLSSVQSAKYISGERAVTPIKAIIAGAILGELYQIYGLRIEKNKGSEFKFVTIFFFAMGGLGLSVVLGSLLPDDYIHLEEISAEEFQKHARYPETIPGWIEKLNVQKKGK